MDTTDLDIERGFWYIATPYSKVDDGVEVAARRAAIVAAAFVASGVPAYCPIAESHFIAMASDLDPLDHEMWMEHDAPMMEAAHGLIVAMLPGWEESVGVAMEIEAFEAAGKPVRYLDPSS